MGHVHKQSLKMNNISNKIRVANNDDICSTCVEGKMKAVPFPKTCSNRTDSTLQLIHSDVVGPFLHYQKVEINTLQYLSMTILDI